MKKIIVISTSHHDKSSSEKMARAFADQCLKDGHEVEYIDLRNLRIDPCKGCYGCAANNHHCIYHDNAPAIVDKIADSDIVVWATPVYFYEMAGQMKTLIDRTVAIFDTKPRFKDVYLLVSAGETDPKIAARIEAGLQGWVECFPGSELKGTVFAGGGKVDADDLKRVTALAATI